MKWDTLALGEANHRRTKTAALLRLLDQQGRVALGCHPLGKGIVAAA